MGVVGWGGVCVWGGGMDGAGVLGGGWGWAGAGLGGWGWVGGVLANSSGKPEKQRRTGCGRGEGGQGGAVARLEWEGQLVDTGGGQGGGTGAKDSWAVRTRRGRAEGCDGSWGKEANGEGTCTYGGMGAQGSTKHGMGGLAEWVGATSRGGAGAVEGPCGSSPPLNPPPPTAHPPATCFRPPGWRDGDHRDEPPRVALFRPGLQGEGDSRSRAAFGTLCPRSSAPAAVCSHKPQGSCSLARP